MPDPESVQNVATGAGVAGVLLAAWKMLRKVLAESTPPSISNDPDSTIPPQFRDGHGRRAEDDLAGRIDVLSERVDSLRRDVEQLKDARSEDGASTQRAIDTATAGLSNQIKQVSDQVGEVRSDIRVLMGRGK